VAGVGRVRAKYSSFQELLALNNESLELMARLQEDLQYALPHREVLADHGENGRDTIAQHLPVFQTALGRLRSMPNSTR